MSFLPQVELDENSGPLAAYRESFGFVPNLLRAEALLPRIVQAHASLESALLIREKVLPRLQKEVIALGVAAAHENTYCITAHSMRLRSLGMPETQLTQLLRDFHNASLSACDVAAVDFSLKLSRHARWVNSEDIQALRRCGFEDESVLEIVLVTAFACFLCVLAAGLGAEPDFKPRRLPSGTKTAPRQPARQISSANGQHTSAQEGPYLRAPYQSPTTFAPFVSIQKSHGFIPNFFRAQTLRPDVLEAEVHAVLSILLPADVLSRAQKECILLAVSAANFNSYCVAVHCNMLLRLGLSPEEADQVAVDHHQSGISKADKSLLDFAVKLGAHPSEFRRKDIDLLRAAGFSDEQILECVAVTALNNFANALQMGLGIVPDFEPPVAFGAKKMHPLASDSRPMVDESDSPPPTNAAGDPDAELVAQAQGGSLEAFEALIRRRSGSVYRTLVAILADPEEAKDAMQDVFLSAFKHISSFEGRSKFATWLVSITRNTGIQRLRDRKNMESLDSGGPEEEEFRPRQVNGWGEDPERMYSHSEIQRLVENGIMQLPTKLRVAVMLRDIEQLSTEEAARQLGLSVPALKARLLRGRLMLREILSPHFTASAKRMAL